MPVDPNLHPISITKVIDDIELSSLVRTAISLANNIKKTSE